MHDPEESMELTDFDREHGFEKVLIGVPSIDQHMGDPNLVPAIVKHLGPGYRLVKVIDPILGGEAYQIEMYSKDPASSLGPEWFPSGHPRTTPEAAQLYLRKDEAMIRKYFPARIHVPDVALELTCPKCREDFTLRQASIRFDEEIVCPHCNNKAVGEENAVICGWG